MTAIMFQLSAPYSSDVDYVITDHMHQNDVNRTLIVWMSSLQFPELDLGFLSIERYPV